MNKQEFLKRLNELPKGYAHAKNILAKEKEFAKLNRKQQDALLKIEKQYELFLDANRNIGGYSKEDILARVDVLNNYYDFFETYYNMFTSQGKLRPTILEEFMYILFSGLIEERRVGITEHNRGQLGLGSTKAYSNLYFTGADFNSFVEKPIIAINTKDQDFSIYRSVALSGEDQDIQFNVPIVAIENKTYLDKTMLEGAIATAEKIKMGNPYSKFLVVAETYEVRLDVDPVYSRIDQIFVLRKSNRKEKKPISFEVVMDLFDTVKNHIERNWSNVEAKLKATGKII